MSRTLSYFAAFIGALCVYFIIHLFFSTHVRTVRNDVIQGFLIGFGLAFVTAHGYARIKAVKVNGWITMFGLGKPGNGMFLRAAHAQLFPGPVNVQEEAMYWWTNADGTGRTLSGRHDYVLHFPAGQLPPNHAFWSLTMGTARNHFVPNSIKRYSLSDRSGLLTNADGSIDIYIQNAAPTGHESNWLPAPSGNFILWLRVYEPGEAILDGEYTVPPVVRAKNSMTLEHLLIFGGVCVITWLSFIYLWPSFILRVFKRAILVKGFGDGPIAVNTLHTESQALFADPLHPPASASKLGTTGVNRDTLITIGWLDLNKGPQVLHVPDMAGRYYSVQFTDPSNNTNFAYVGKRTTGTEAGDYLIAGPRWKATVPNGMKQISSPNNSVLVVGRILVYSDNDLPNAYNLAKQIQVVSLTIRQPRQ
jgi:hypothetical protein